VVAAGVGDHAYNDNIYDADTQSWSPGDFDEDKDADVFISRINSWLHNE